MWKHIGLERPNFADIPTATQESVWDYPRPPALQKDTRTITVFDGNTCIANSTQCYRVLETASPPTFYISTDDIDMQQLRPIVGNSYCEWKGIASYWTLARDESLQMIAWNYPNPSEAFAPIKNYIAFYPGRINCFINDEKVRPQDGGFYGGWVSDDIVGPWKGNEGTTHW